MLLMPCFMIFRPCHNVPLKGEKNYKICIHRVDQKEALHTSNTILKMALEFYLHLYFSTFLPLLFHGQFFFTKKWLRF